LGLCTASVNLVNRCTRQGRNLALASGSASRGDPFDAGCRRLHDMRIATGKVVQGKLELDGDSLEEGVTVTVLVPEPDETFELTPDEELALEESLKQAARGEFVDEEALLRELSQ